MFVTTEQDTDWRSSASRQGPRGRGRRSGSWTTTQSLKVSIHCLNISTATVMIYLCIVHILCTHYLSGPTCTSRWPRIGPSRLGSSWPWRMEGGWAEATAAGSHRTGNININIFYHVK